MENRDKGLFYEPGMAFAIEPMITMGNYEVYVTDDGWTVKTVDKSLAAHVEDTIVITEDGPKILTQNIMKRLSMKNNDHETKRRSYKS